MKKVVAALQQALWVGQEVFYSYLDQSHQVQVHCKKKVAAAPQQVHYKQCQVVRKEWG